MTFHRFLSLGISLTISLVWPVAIYAESPDYIYFPSYSSCKIEEAAKENQGQKLWDEYRSHVIADYLINGSTILSSMTKYLAEISEETGHAHLGSAAIKAAFESYCAHKGGASMSQESRDPVNLDAEFEFGFSQSELVSAYIWGETGHLLLHDMDRSDLARPFLDAAMTANNFDVFPHAEFDDEEANPGILDFQYRLLANRAHLFGRVGDKEGTTRQGQLFADLLKAHKAHDKTSSSMAPDEMSLMIIEDLNASGAFPLAQEIFSSEHVSFFEGLGTISSPTNFLDDLRLYDFMVINNFHVIDPKDYTASLRYETLLRALPPSNIRLKADWETVLSSNALRLRNLATLLPPEHSILQREQFYNDIYTASHDAIEQFYDDISQDGKLAYSQKQMHGLSPAGVQKLLERLAFWKNEFKSTADLHPHDLGMRIWEIYDIEHALKVSMPHLTIRPETTAEYISEHIPGLHYNQIGAVHEALAKDYMSRPYYYRRGVETQDPLAKIMGLYPRSCAGRSIADLEHLHARRSEFLSRLDDFKKAFDIAEIGYAQLRPKLKPIAPGTFRDPYKIRPIIDWLETGNFEILKQAYPIIEPCDEIAFDE